MSIVIKSPINERYSYGVGRLDIFEGLVKVLMTIKVEKKEKKMIRAVAENHVLTMKKKTRRQMKIHCMDR
jgi:hypothetical protein